MKKQTIEVEGLPEGWKAVAFRCPGKGDYYYDVMEKRVSKAAMQYEYQRLIVEKIQPRRIVLEEITKEEYYRIFHDEPFAKIYDMRGSYWREVKETTNDEPKLSLSVDENHD